MNGDPKQDRRNAKRRKERYGMQVSGRSIKTVLLPLLGKTRKGKARTRPAHSRRG